LIQNTKSSHIAREQIGRALNPHEFAPYGFGKPLGQCRFSKTRQVIKEHVSPSQQTRQQEFDDLGFAQEDLIELISESSDPTLNLPGTRNRWWLGFGHRIHRVQAYLSVV
jgi:hypothetical protein